MSWKDKFYNPKRWTMRHLLHKVYILKQLLTHKQKYTLEWYKYKVKLETEQIKKHVIILEKLFEDMEYKAIFPRKKK